MSRVVPFALLGQSFYHSQDVYKKGAHAIRLESWTQTGQLPLQGHELSYVPCKEGQNIFLLCNSSSLELR